jgi:Domain of unknown function (DUF4160)
MPVICRFLGIAIAILYRDHNPPHFHAIYGEHEITVNIDDGSVTGKFPRRAQALVLEWLALLARSCGPIGSAHGLASRSSSFRHSNRFRRLEGAEVTYASRP